jgi:hypothetical protein
MSEIKVDKISPQSGTSFTLGDSGDTFTVPAGATFDASSGTLTLPDGSVANAKLENSSITINGSSVSLGGSTTIATGTSWQTVKTANFNAAVNEGYWVNTTSAAITATLPGSPTLGDTISFVDYAGTFDTNNLTIGRNGKNIQGSAADLTVNVERAGLTLVFVDDTQGWLLLNN